MSTTLTPADLPRLRTLQQRVTEVMSDGGWHMLVELSQRCGGTEASCSARIRDLRKMGWTVARKQKSPGLFLYAARKLSRPEQMDLL